ncbi:MAG: Wzz/FepE/Etk N-terminal domain-containing protein [Clostridiales bacterium]
MFFYLNILRKRLFLIVSGVIIIMIISYYYNYHVLSNVYKSYSTIHIGAIKNDKDSSMGSDLGIADIMIIDYREFITSRMVLDDVVEQLKIQYGKKNLSYEVLKDNVFVNLRPNTRILEISFEDSDPVFSKVVAEEIKKSFVTKAKTLTSIDNTHVIDEPAVPKVPERPVRRNNILFSLIASLAIMSGLSILIELLDNRIRSQENLEMVSKIKVLATIPEVEFEKKKKKISLFSMKSKYILGETKK